MTNNRNQDIAVVGSPSTNTELTLDLLQEATEERVVGALTAFQATQNGQTIVSVGQVVGIELKNRWHEDSVFRNLVKRTGEIPPITNRQDTRIADLVVGATFRQSQSGFEPEVLGMVPPTGTRVRRVDQGLLDNLLAVYRQEIVYLGQAYANEVLYPMWFKHFGSNDQGMGGAGEAYHIGVFGKTGSGKSGLAKMMLCAYAQHPQLGILIIDPQGEFSLEFSGKRVGSQGLPLDQIVKNQGREIHVLRIKDLQLDDWDTFEEMLLSLRFLEHLGIPSSSVANSRKAAEIIRRSLEGTHHLDNLGTEQVLNDVLAEVCNDDNAIYIYTKQRAKDLQNRIQRLQSDKNLLTQVLNQSWVPICRLFSRGQNRQRLFSYPGQQPGIINMLLGSVGISKPRPVIVIDISKQGNQDFWSEELQRRMLGKLLNILVSQATSSLSTQQSANVLVLLDEAHRHAPSGRLEPGSEAERLRQLLCRAVRETRKYGLGWFFISQTLGGIDPEILQQLRILSFGFGLAMGSEFDRLKDFAGGDKRSLELYQSFRDPQSFPLPKLKEFPFMAVGPISPLAFSGKPVFFNMFTDMQRFLDENNMSQRNR